MTDPLVLFTRWWEGNSPACEMQAAEECWLAGHVAGRAESPSRADLEALPTEELVRIKALLGSVLAARVPEGPGLRVPKVRGPAVLPMVRLLREALGLGLREAKELVECGAPVEIPDTDAGRRLREAIENFSAEAER